LSLPLGEDSGCGRGRAPRTRRLEAATRVVECSQRLPSRRQLALRSIQGDGELARSARREPATATNTTRRDRRGCCRNPLLLALAIHPDETRDLCALRENGWELADPDEVAATPAAFQCFVQGSTAELGVAKTGYVMSRCAWFSDRSACYLASGRPVVAQDTGFGEHLPTGEGLFAFSDAEQAAAVLDELGRDYAGHRRAARALAEEHLDSDRVLTRILERL
jgi:hypothetical protein